MKYRTTFEADRDIIDIYVLGAEQFGVGQSERDVDELFGLLTVAFPAKNEYPSPTILPMPAMPCPSRISATPPAHPLHR